jgi:hypothetical protein
MRQQIKICSNMCCHKSPLMYSYMLIYNIKTQRDDGLTIPLWKEDTGINQDFFKYVFSQITFNALI